MFQIARQVPTPCLFFAWSGRSQQKMIYHRNGTADYDVCACTV